MADDLSEKHVESLISALKRYKRAMGWTIDDIIGIPPGIGMHKGHLEEDCMPTSAKRCKLRRSVSNFDLDVLHVKGGTMAPKDKKSNNFTKRLEKRKKRARCLKCTQDYALHYNKYSAILEGYSDAKWITESNEVKSTSGYVFTIGEGAVSWKLSKQTYIDRSTMESEFISLNKAGEEEEWLHNFLEYISYWPKPVAPVCIHCDRQAAIGRARNMMYNGKSHHIRQRLNTVKELLSSGIITVDYVKSKDNVLDPLTIGLSKEGVERTSKKMGLRPRTSQHGGNVGVAEPKRLF
ncbi:hypothetical protein CQW23_06105 [Capsicum baccatum]|uniref:Retrovirus-related Pol polyprotein from transposon TNT 1-94 n=1 Tax=Capsicum baccatum TaxID=33114 RepID=A0A2G2X2G8_CAPBA|nr:hypothetical protein CQW23_06105 [Capsicum baccatum]